MASYTEFVTARTPEEAYELNQKKSSVIVAGNMWLRMCGLRRKTAIDLSALGLDKIEESGDAFTIGAMVSLRDMETHARLNGAFGGAFAEALSPIVGTQFRRTATVGGSVYSRFGFSDVSALLLALDAQVLCYRRGEVPLVQYQREPWDRDILLGVRIRKGQRAAAQSVRINGTDLPLLVCAASLEEEKLRFVLGARPARAMIVAQGLAPDTDARAFEAIAAGIPMGSNRRASEAYRRRIAPVLMERAAAAVRGEGGVRA